MKVITHNKLLQHGLVSLAVVAAAAITSGCTPPVIPPQQACAPSLGGNLALHDPSSLNSYPSPEWGFWGGDFHNTHHAAGESTIDVGNVANLVVKGSFTAAGSVEVSPTIQGDIMYFTDMGPGIDFSSNFAGSTLYAVDRTDMSLVWSKAMRDYNDNDFGNMTDVSPAIAGDLIIIGDYQNPAPMSSIPDLLTHKGRYNLGYDDPCGGYVTAIKRDGPNAGEKVWSTRIGEDDYAMVRQSAVVYNETVFVGLSSQESTYGRIASFPCCSHRGKIVALDVHTGAIKWQRYMTPPQTSGEQGFSGASVWGGAPTIDEARNLVYVPTGNNFTVPESFEVCVAAANGDLLEIAACAAIHDVMENYFDSIVAVDIDDGTVAWSFKSSDYDPWNTACDFDVILPLLASVSSYANCAVPKGPDADFAQPPMLYQVDVGGGVMEDRLAAGTKGGKFFILDPDASSELERVIFGEQVGPGGKIGGMEFGAATDGTRIYVQNANFDHTPYTLEEGSAGHVGETIIGGFWAALDAKTGQTLWETPIPNVPHNAADLEGTIFHLVWGAVGEQFFSWPYAPLTVANGLVYAAVADWKGTYVAMDAQTGEILWSFETGFGSVAAPTVLDGNIYWGSGSKYSKPGARKLYKFGLP